MSHHTSDAGNRAQPDGSRPLAGTTSRRTFLKATAAGAAAGGLTATTVGTVASEGIPTPFLERDGNLIRNSENGEKVILRGVNIADPRRIDETAPARGKNTDHVIDTATNEWNARVVRLPVHPGDVAGLPPVPEADVQVHEPMTFDEDQLQRYCEQHLDPAVEKCAEVGAYAIVDYHRHWGDGTLEWNDDTLSQEVELFWDFVAPRYSGDSHVIYEMYNEPTSPNMGATPVVNDWSAGIWDDWIETCQPWIDTIRGHADNLTLVGSPMWSQYPDGALVREPDGDNLGYTYHIYPGHSISDSGDWDGEIQGSGDQAEDQNNGEGVYECYEEVPLFVTEFGWQHDAGAYPTDGTLEGYGKPFFEWLNENPIHWTAWCFDPTWLSAMVERPFDTDDSTDDSIGDPYSGEIPQYCDDMPCDWVAKPAPDMGEYTKQQLADLANEDVPTSDTGPTAPTSPADQWTNEVTATTIELAWESVSNAAHYNVYRDGTPVAEPTGTTHTFENLDPETTYAIGLEAENDADTSGVEEIDVTTEPDDTTTPDCEGAEGGSTTVDGQTVCDVNDDGYYRDVTGDGSVGQGDVAEFFTKQHRSAWKQPDMFDFSGNDAVTHGDVVELFDYVALNG